MVQGLEVITNRTRKAMVDTWRLGIFCSLERCENQVLLPAWTQVGGNGRSLQITPKLDKRHRQEKWKARKLVTQPCFLAFYWHRLTKPHFWLTWTATKIPYLGDYPQRMMFRRLGKRFYSLWSDMFYYVSTVGGLFTVSSHCHFGKFLPRCEYPSVFIHHRWNPRNIGLWAWRELMATLVYVIHEET